MVYVERGEGLVLNLKNKKPMNIVHLVASDSGGAYRAAERISDSLNRIGENSIVVVLEKKRQGSNVYPFFYKKKFRLFVFKVVRKIESKKLKKMKLTSYFYESSLGVNLYRMNEVKRADVINIHWVNDGMVSYKELKRLCKSGKKVVWTMHDMFSFTAGCYYDQECGGYQNGCQNCPMVRNIKNGQKFIDRLYLKKESAYIGEIGFIGCSKWISKCAQNSTLLEKKAIITIPNPIDSGVFKPVGREDCYKLFPMVKNDAKKNILFGAMMATSDPRKGYKYLIEALKYIEEKDKYRLIVFGGSRDYTVPVDIECVSVGSISNDDKLVALYSLADVFVAPSLQENLSNAVMESLACGTPVAAFNIGGMQDLICNGETGCLVDPFDEKMLSEAIQILAMKKDNFTYKCREKACRDFSMQRVGNAYRNFYLEDYTG